MLELFDTEVFPAHLSDKTRLQLATEILHKETLKQGWQADLERPRSLLDFWDTFHAIMGTWLLKSGLVRMLTAENWTWQRTIIPTQKIQLSAYLEQLRVLPNLTPDELFMPKIAAAMDSAERVNQRQAVESFSQNAVQNTYPVVAVQKGEWYKVMDGNRRSLLALLQGTPQVEAWVAKTRDQPPRNYWIPLDHMMQIVSEARQNPDKLAHYQAIAHAWFQESEVAYAAYTHRVMGMKGSESLLPKNLPK